MTARSEVRFVNDGIPTNEPSESASSRALLGLAPPTPNGQRATLVAKTKLAGDESILLKAFS